MSRYETIIDAYNAAVDFGLTDVLDVLEVIYKAVPDVTAREIVDVLRKRRPVLQSDPLDDVCPYCRSTDIRRVGPKGRGSWVCSQCFKHVYGSGHDFSKEELRAMFHGGNIFRIPDA